MHWWRAAVEDGLAACVPAGLPRFLVYLQGRVFADVHLLSLLLSAWPLASLWAVLARRCQAGRASEDEAPAALDNAAANSAGVALGDLLADLEAMTERVVKARGQLAAADIAPELLRLMATSEEALSWSSALLGLDDASEPEEHPGMAPDGFGRASEFLAGKFFARLRSVPSVALWGALAQLQEALSFEANVQRCSGAVRQLGDSAGLCPACAVRVQTEWLHEAWIVDSIWQSANQFAFGALAVRLAASGRGYLLEALATEAETEAEAATLGEVVCEAAAWPRRLEALHARRLLEEGAPPAAPSLQRPQRPQGSRSRSRAGSGWREAVASILFARGEGSGRERDSLWVQAEALRTLAHAVRSAGGSSRPFIVLTPVDLPSDVTDFLTDGGVTEVRRAAVPNEFEGAVRSVRPELELCWLKLTLWSLTDYDAVVYLDIDTLPLVRAPLEPLFALLGGAGVPYAAAPYGPGVGARELQSGVLALRPSLALFGCLLSHVANRTFLGVPGFQHLGGNVQAFLDMFWRAASPRVGANAGDVSGAVVGCGGRRPAESRVCPGVKLAPHCVLSASYNFPVSFSAVAEMGRSLRSGDYWAWQVPVAESWGGLLQDEPVRVAHWPGDARKPWAHWASLSRTFFDRRWWRAHEAMCRDSVRGGCRLRCT